MDCKNSGKNATHALSSVTNKLMGEGGIFSCSAPDPNALHWDFLSAASWAMTVFTSVGYGNFAVATESGKAFVCAYAIVGFVLYGYASSVFASSLTDLFLVIAAGLAKCMTWCRMSQRPSNNAEGGSTNSTSSQHRPTAIGSSPKPQPMEQETTAFMEQETTAFFARQVLTLSLLVLVLVLSAFLVQPLSGDDVGIGAMLLNGIWWAFVATSTIGLGDFVPLPQWRYFIIHFVILVIGVTLFGLLVQQGLLMYVGLQHSIESKVHIDELTEAEVDEMQEQEDAIQQKSHRKLNLIAGFNAPEHLVHTQPKKNKATSPLAL
jgi:hypothetical protein